MVACLRIGDTQQRSSAGHVGQGPAGLREPGAGSNPPPSLRPGHGRAVLGADRPAGCRRRQRSPGCHPGAVPGAPCGAATGYKLDISSCWGMRAVRCGRQAVVPGELCQRRRGLSCWAALAAPSDVIEASSRRPAARRGRRLIVAGNDGAHRFDHVVSVMFENRSFDNLLGICTTRARSRPSKAWPAASCPTPSRARARRRAGRGAGARGHLDGCAQPRRGRGAPPHQHPAVRDGGTRRQPVPVL